MAKKPLPYKWRQKVKQTLEKQGVKLDTQQIYDITRGRSTDEVLTKKVISAMNKVKKQDQAKKQKIASLVAKKQIA
jgi:hemerythrin-like domain-containing protein